MQTYVVLEVTITTGMSLDFHDRALLTAWEYDLLSRIAIYTERFVAINSRAQEVFQIGITYERIGFFVHIHTMSEASGLRVYLRTSIGGEAKAIVGIGNRYSGLGIEDIT